MDEKNLSFETLAVHGGQTPDPVTGSRAVPIYQTTSYVFKNTNSAAKLFALEEPGHIYTRISNPTTEVFENRLSLLEGGVGAVATSSGMAAISLAILNITRAGEEVVSANTLYGGTYNLFTSTFEKMGIKTHFVNPKDPESFKKAITEKTRLIYAETEGNPRLNTVDLEAVAKIAHDAGIPFIVDNTMTTPYIVRPLEWGVDVVVHSATKFIGGHGTCIAGAVVDGGTFNWKNGKFPELCEPDPSYQGISYTETFGKQAYIVKLRAQLLRDLGPAISPFNAWLLLQGLETLPVRMERHCCNAQKLAEHLAQHPKVSWVTYPGLPGYEGHDLATKYYRNGFGAIIGFGIKGGKEAGGRFIDALQVFSDLANIGDAKSLAIHPASTTHQQLTAEQLQEAGIGEDFIRLSVGLENIQDIIADIDQALDKA